MFGDSSFFTLHLVAVFGIVLGAGLSMAVIWMLRKQHRKYANTLRSLDTRIQDFRNTRVSAEGLLDLLDREHKFLAKQTTSIFIGFGIEVQIVRVVKDHPWPQHSHEDSYQIFIAWHGGVEIRIFDKATDEPAIIKRLHRDCNSINGKCGSANLVSYAARGKHHEIHSISDHAELLVISVPPLTEFEEKREPEVFDGPTI